MPQLRRQQPAPLAVILLCVTSGETKGLNGMEEVVGSIPTRSTKYLNN